MTKPAAARIKTHVKKLLAAVPAESRPLIRIHQHGEMSWGELLGPATYPDHHYCRALNTTQKFPWGAVVICTRDGAGNIYDFICSAGVLDKTPRTDLELSRGEGL